MNLRWQLARLYGRIAPTNRGGFALARWARRGLARDNWRGVFTPFPAAAIDLDLSTYPDCNMALGLYEPETARLLRRLLRPGSHFVDGGANIGYFTLLAARAVGPTGRVDAIEPEEHNRQRLMANLQRNAVTNVQLHPVALAAQSGPITLYQPAAGQNHGEATVHPALVPGGSSLQVPAVRMDELIDQPPTCIKLDVEGNELAALRGAERLLSGSKPPALVVEHNRDSAAAAGYQLEELFDYLLGVQPRYRAYWIGWRLRPLQREDLPRLRRQGNLLFMRRD